MGVEMVVDGYSTVAEGKVGYGDHYTYKVTISLPKIHADSKIDMDVRITSLQPVTGLK